MKQKKSDFLSIIDSKTSLARFIAFLLVITLLCASASAYITEAANPDAVATLSKIGSRGAEVRKVQTKLRELGFYNGSVDGIYGVGTQRAVRRFQASVGINVDGIAGPKTLLYLGIDSSSGGGSYGSYSSSDMYLLAKVIEAEARGEGYIGQVAVGAVVLNRVESASFPDTISGVVYQSGAFSAVTDSNWSVTPTATSRKAAQDAVNGWDPSYGSIYYYNPAKTSNKWIRTRPVVTTIGSHVFCK
ncbi:MAG: spore cortex-lytic enzyme [Clostridia bacterium]|nr:spore cortex-lytic enzyme [Clostridia bacterium]